MSQNATDNLCSGWHQYPCHYNHGNPSHQISQIMFLVIWLWWNFALVTAALLLWPVPNFFTIKAQTSQFNQIQANMINPSPPMVSETGAQLIGHQTDAITLVTNNVSSSYYTVPGGIKGAHCKHRKHGSCFNKDRLSRNRNSDKDFNKDCLSKHRNSDKDKTAMLLCYLYNGNSYIGSCKMESL